MNLGEFLNATFTKIGIAVDNDALKEIVTKASTIEISDELTGKHNSSYMTLDAAQNNPQLMKHFYGPALNGVDSAILNIVKDFGYTDEVRSEIELEKNTYKKLDILSKKIKEFESQKGALNKNDKDDLKKLKEEYENTIGTLKSSHEAEVTNLKNGHNETLKDVYLTQFLSGQNYASPLAKEESYLLPKSKLNSVLKDKGLKVSLENNGFKLQTEQGTDYFENNSKVDFKTFAEKVLADNKFTTISEPPKPSNPTHIKTDLDKTKLSGVAAYDSAIAEAEAN